MWWTWEFLAPAIVSAVHIAVKLTVGENVLSSSFWRHASARRSAFYFAIARSGFLLIGNINFDARTFALISFGTRYQVFVWRSFSIETWIAKIYSLRSPEARASLKIDSSVLGEFIFLTTLVTSRAFLLLRRASIRAFPQTLCAFEFSSWIKSIFQEYLSLLSAAWDVRVTGFYLQVQDRLSVSLHFLVIYMSNNQWCV